MAPNSAILTQRLAERVLDASVLVAALLQQGLTSETIIHGVLDVLRPWQPREIDAISEDRAQAVAAVLDAFASALGR